MPTCPKCHQKIPLWQVRVLGRPGFLPYVGRFWFLPYPPRFYKQLCMRCGTWLKPEGDLPARWKIFGIGLGLLVLILFYYLRLTPAGQESPWVAPLFVVLLVCLIVSVPIQFYYLARTTTFSIDQDSMNLLNPLDSDKAPDDKP